MTGFDRVKAAFKRQRADRVPFYPIVSGLAGQLIGIDAKTYYTDHEVTVITGGETYVETVTMDATKTVQIPAVTDVPWPGDLNTDLAVDIIDLNMVLIDWGKSVPNLADDRSDADGSGTVDIVDLNTVLIDWGKTGYETP